MRAASCFTPKPGSRPLLDAAPRTARRPSTRTSAGSTGCVTSSMPAIASRIAVPPSSSPRSHPSRPRWYSRRCLTRCDGSRSPARPRAARGRGARGDEVGIEEIGRRGGLDAARALHRLVLGEQLERHRRRAVRELVEEDAQLAARAIDRVERGWRRRGRRAPRARVSWRSISSVNATTASSPTIWIAPAAWCTCARACLSDALSRGLAADAASASRPRASAWSISPWTHDSGPRSKSAEESIGT